MTKEQDTIIEWILLGIFIPPLAIVVWAVIFLMLSSCVKDLIARRRASKARKAAENRNWPASPHQISPESINIAAPPYSRSISNKIIPDTVRYTQYNMKGSHELQDLKAARITETTH